MQPISTSGAFTIVEHGETARYDRWTGDPSECLYGPGGAVRAAFYPAGIHLRQPHVRVFRDGSFGRWGAEQAAPSIPTPDTQGSAATTNVRIITRTYDRLDRLETETVQLVDGRIATVSYTYWNNGLRKTFTDAFGRVTYYEYDSHNRLCRLTANQNQPDEQVTVYTYWPDSLLKTVSKPDGTTVFYDYDAADRVTGVLVRRGDEVLVSYAYEYDRNGNRTQQTELNGGASEITTYTYDALNRLETVTYPDGRSVEYRYDLVGNREGELERDAAGVLTSHKVAVFDRLSRPVTVTDSLNPANDATFAHDRNGNLIARTTSAGTTRYVYDVSNRLVETRDGEQVTARFAYDVFGRRYLKIGEDGLRQYLYDGTSLLHELSEHSVEVAKYEWGGDRLVSLFRVDEPRRYFHFDALGSVAALTEAGGAVVARYHYDAWGLHRARGELDASSNRFGFTAYYFDRETDLYYAKARYFDPQYGRFLTQDSYLGEIDNPPSLHRYFYAHANPTRYVDPTGHGALSILLKAGKVLVKGGEIAEIFADVRADFEAFSEAETFKDQLGLGISLASNALPISAHDVVDAIDFINAARSGDAHVVLETALTRTKVGRVVQGAESASNATQAALDGDLERAAREAGNAAASLGAGRRGSGGMAAATTNKSKQKRSDGGSTPQLGDHKLSTDGGGDRKPAGDGASDAKSSTSRRKAGVPGPEFEPMTGVGEYKRPTGAGPTTAQRRAVQGQPCVDCGDVAPRQVADHKKPLVVEHYETGTVDVTSQSSVEAVQPHCPTCSSEQGGQLSAFSRKMKERIQRAPGQQR